jgi:hypothetical protein
LTAGTSRSTTAAICIGAAQPYLYSDQDRLLAALMEKVIGPAEKMAKEHAVKPSP